MCHLLLAQLSDLLDPTIEGHAQLGHLRVVQRCSRTVLRCFHAQLGAKCGAFIEVLLSGAPERLRMAFCCNSGHLNMGCQHLLARIVIVVIMIVCCANARAASVQAQRRRAHCGSA